MVNYTPSVYWECQLILLHVSTIKIYQFTNSFFKVDLPIEIIRFLYLGLAQCSTENMLEYLCMFLIIFIIIHGYVVVKYVLSVLS